MTTLVLVGGGTESLRGVEIARALGYRVAVLDGNRDAPGLGEADEPLLVSTYDVEGAVASVEALSLRTRVVGVASVAIDAPVTVATIAERFGLPGIPLEAARLSSDKIRMKQRFARMGIPTPRFWPVQELADFREALGASHAELFVIKPADSRGARGVLLVRRGDDLADRLEESMSNSPSRRCLIEEFQFGPQISSESFVTTDWAETPGFADRNYLRVDETDPYIIEDGGEAPSVVSQAARDEASALAVAAGRALGLSRGVVKGDLVITEHGPKVIEVALRLSGGWFCTHQIPLLTGVDLVEATIRTAVGETIERDSVAPRDSGGVAIRYYFPPEGRVCSVPDREVVLSQPGVKHFGLNVVPGDSVGRVTNHTRRAGHVIAVGSSRDDAIRRVETVIRQFPIETQQVVS